MKFVRIVKEKRKSRVHHARRIFVNTASAWMATIIKLLSVHAVTIEDIIAQFAVTQKRLSAKGVMELEK